MNGIKKNVVINGNPENSDSSSKRIIMYLFIKDNISNDTYNTIIKFMIEIALISNVY